MSAPNRFGSNLAKSLIIMPIDSTGAPASSDSPNAVEIIVDGAPVSEDNPFPVSMAGGGPAAVGATANSSGNSTITPTGSNQIQIVTVTGVARTSVFILDVAGRQEGDTLELRFEQPATAAIVEEIRNATVGGTLLYSYTTDGSGADNLYCKLYFNGTAWKPLMNVVPVI
jgi:hypothetical protein